MLTWSVGQLGIETPSYHYEEVTEGRILSNGHIQQSEELCHNGYDNNDPIILEIIPVIDYYLKMNIPIKRVRQQWIW